MSRASTVLLVVAACGAPAPPPPALARAERLEHDGADSVEAYREAAVSCTRGKYCADAWLGYASALARAGQTRQAAEVYEALPARLDPARAAAALAGAGTQRLLLGEAEVAYRHFWRAITDYPDTAAADDCLRYIADDGGKRAPRQLYDVLLRLYPRLVDKQIADNLLYTAAKLAVALGDPAAALSLYDRLLAAHPKSQLWDDSAWLAAGLARGRGDAAGALRRYRALTARREVALMAGSYFSPWMPQAQLEIGRLLRDELHEPKQAVIEFGRVGALYPDSILRDDALWERARTEDELGDAAAACRTLATLEKDFPESRWELELAPALRVKLGCAG